MITQGSRASSRSPRPFWTVAVLLATLALTHSSKASALDLSAIDPQISTLRFGEGVEGVLAWVGKRLEKAYHPRIVRAVDANERARLVARRDQELVLMRNDEQVFDGRVTGLEVSIVSGEFGAGTGESLFRFQEGEATHYFFIREGKLWKYVRVLSSGSSFLGRLATFQGVLGEPVAMADETDGEGGRRLVSVTWQNLGFDFRLVNRRIVYGSDIFVMEDRKVATELVEARKKAAKAGAVGVDPGLEQFFLDDPDTYGAPPPEDTPKPPDEKPKR